MVGFFQQVGKTDLRFDPEAGQNYAFLGSPAFAAYHKPYRAQKPTLIKKFLRGAKVS